MQIYLQDSPRALILVPPTSSGHFALVISSNGSGLLSTSSSASRTSFSSGNDGSRSGSTGRPGAGGAATRVAAELVDLEEIPFNSLRKMTSSPVEGCLGFMNIGQDLFLAVVTSATSVGSVRPGEIAMRVTSVAFFCINKSLWDDTLISSSSSSSSNFDQNSNSAADSEYGYSGAGDTYQSSIYDHPCAGLRKYMSSGTFYYARQSSWDISTRLDRRISTLAISTPNPGEEAQGHTIADYDDRFVWNSYMIEPLLEYRSRMEPEEQRKLDAGGFVLCAIQGYVGVQALSGNGYMPVDLPVGSGPEANRGKGQTSISLISRLSWKRAGTRFNSRGIDDDGNVANFVESELIFCHEGVSYSHVQIRGSVPLFWEQAGLQALNARIQITRPQAASQSAFDRHFAELLSQYSRVHALNLLGTRDIETVLTNTYSEHMKESAAAEAASLVSSDDISRDGYEDEKAANSQIDESEVIGLTNFDFHSTSRAVGGIDGVRSELKNLAPVRDKTNSFAFTIVDRESAVRLQQRGVFRTNCLDCLDRANVVQDFVSQFALAVFFERAASAPGSGDLFVGFGNLSHPLWGCLRSLWGHNGDALSRIYAGTGALNTSFTKSGKKTLGGLLSNAVKSAARTYINNLQDKDKQNVIDLLLGLMANQSPVRIIDVIHDAVEARLLDRLEEFSEEKQLTIFAGTWNLNGRPPGESLETWLFPDGSTEADIFALGFQEIVELTAGQILMTDPFKKKIWEAAIMNTFVQRASRSDKKEQTEYVLLRSEQLVGTALIVIVKKTLLPVIRSVEAATKKTGLKGMSGNKGGVGVRLTCYDSSICFMTAHFAAGQSNVEERNADFWTISQGLVFSRGKTISAHDLVLWLGDFNYRIDLPNPEVRELSRMNDFDQLHAHDQLLRYKEQGTTFVGLDEGPLLFKPTYKYDNNRDTYDTSEKARTPAWTDRILYRADGLKQLVYYRAELKTSDHRPVYSIFTGELRSVDHGKRRRIYGTILEQLAPGRRAAKAFKASGEGTLVPSDTPYPSSGEYSWWEDKIDGGTTRTGASATRRAPPPKPSN